MMIGVDGLERKMERLGDYGRSRKIRIGDNKWLLIFWRGALVVEQEPVTDLPESPEDQAHFSRLWSDWLALPLHPLTIGKQMVAMDGVQPHYLQQFCTEADTDVYLVRSLLTTYLSDWQNCCYWHPQGSHFVVVSREGQDIAVFAICKPQSPLREVEGSHE